MTIAEAEIYLKLDQYTDLQEAYEFLVFEQRNYFVLKPCIPKVFRAKIKRLDLYIEAAEVLGVNSKADQMQKMDFEMDASSILNVYRDYSFKTSKLKANLCAASTLQEIKHLSGLQLLLFQRYASFWPCFEDFAEGNLLSSELDPMKMIEALMFLESIGIYTFTALSHSEQNIGQLVKREATRLYKLNRMNPDAQGA